MNKIFLVFLIGLMTFSLVFAANGNVETDVADVTLTQTGQGTGAGTQTNTETQTQNSGEESQLQNQVAVESGTYMNQAGASMYIQKGEGSEIKLQSGKVEARTTMAMTQEQVQNKTVLKTQLSNGKNAEIKVMPDTASQTAIERLQLKNCVAEEGCAIELKEVGTGDQVKAVYEIKAETDAKVLGIFKTKLKVQAQIDAETGEVVQAKKPWWSFLTTSSE